MKTPCSISPPRKPGGVLLPLVLTLLALCVSWLVWPPPGRHTPVAAMVAVPLGIALHLFVRGALSTLPSSATPRAWLLIALASFAACAPGAFNYLHQLGSRTFLDNSGTAGKRKVAGTELTRAAAEYNALTQATSKSYLVEQFGGVETAILPVFIDGQSMPDKSRLPGEIRDLADRNGLPLRPDPDFDADAARIIGELVKLWKRGKGAL